MVSVYYKKISMSVDNQYMYKDVSIQLSDLLTCYRDHVCRQLTVYTCVEKQVYTCIEVMCVDN